MITTSSQKRHPLDGQAREATASQLQVCLVDLVDLNMQCKQAHWNLIGRRFYPLHLQLDEIAKTARDAGDEIAERITALDASADGRASTVASHSSLEPFPEGRPHDTQVVTLIADRLAAVVNTLRKGIEHLQDADPVSENLLQDVCHQMEKHLWMMQVQEED
jgi:starvation-inducible DNA-binding protein